MNILLVNHYAGSRQYGMEYRPYYLSREWTRAGHQVHIIGASYSHLRTTNPAVTDRLVSEEQDGVRYSWIRTPAYRGNGSGRVRNIAAFLIGLKRIEAQLVREGRPDIVIASSTYPFDVYPGHRIARKAGARFAYEVHDLWPLTPIELGGMSPRHPLIRMMQRAEDFGYASADVVVSLLPGAREYMLSRGMATHKFVHVPNGIDVDEWNGCDADLPVEHQNAIQRLKREGIFLVGYAGGHGLSNSLETFVDSTACIPKNRVALVLVGDGPAKAELIRRANRLNNGRIVFLSPIPKQTIPLFLSEMDALYMGSPARSIYRFGISPNKLMDYMMAARPVIHANPTCDDWMARCEGGLTVAPDSANAIGEAIVKLVGMTPRERAEMGRRGREYVTAHHDYRHLAERFIQAVR